MMTTTPAPVNPFADVMDMINSISLSPIYVLMELRDNAIIANTEAITNLTTSLTLFINHLDTLTTSGSTISEKGHLSEQNPSSDTGAKPLGVAGIANPTTAIAESVASNTEVLKTISGALKSGAELGESFGLGDKTEKLKKLSEGLNAFGEISDAIDAAKSANGVDSITKISNAISGFTTLVEATNLPTAVIGVGLKSVWNYAQERTASYHPSIDRTTFMSPEVVASTPHLQQIVDNAEYAKQVAKRTKQKPAAQIRDEQERYERDFLAKGGELHFSDTRFREDPAYMSAVVSAMMKSADMPGHPIRNILFDTPELLDNFQKTIDPLHKFPVRLADKKTVSPFHTNGIQNIQEVKDYAKQEEYTPYDLLNFAFQIDYKLKDEVEKGLQGYSQNPLGYATGHEKTIFNMFGGILAAREKSKDYADWYIRGTKDIDADKNVVQTSKVATENKTNTINFNKSLIEHFTINVKDSREGLRDFKRKVEEVLLEILNSINAN
jgi:hypothetical protein